MLSKQKYRDLIKLSLNVYKHANGNIEEITDSIERFSNQIFNIDRFLKGIIFGGLIYSAIYIIILNNVL